MSDHSIAERSVPGYPLFEFPRELARQRPRFGRPRLIALARREMGTLNHRRVERLYGEEGLQIAPPEPAQNGKCLPERPLRCPLTFLSKQKGFVGGSLGIAVKSQLDIGPVQRRRH